MSNVRVALFQRRRMILHAGMAFTVTFMIGFFVLLALRGYSMGIGPHNILGIGVVFGILLSEVFSYLMDEFGIGVIKLHYKDEDNSNEWLNQWEKEGE